MARESFSFTRLWQNLKNTPLQHVTKSKRNLIPLGNERNLKCVGSPKEPLVENLRLSYLSKYLFRISSIIRRRYTRYSIKSDKRKKQQTKKKKKN